VSKKHACADSLHTYAAHVDAGWCRRIIDLNGDRRWHNGAAGGSETPELTKLVQMVLRLVWQRNVDPFRWPRRCPMITLSPVVSCWTQSALNVTRIADSAGPQLGEQHLSSCTYSGGGTDEGFFAYDLTAPTRSRSPRTSPRDDPSEPRECHPEQRFLALSLATVRNA